MIQGCGGIIKRPGINISPPSSGDGSSADGSSYSHNKECKWIIVAPPGNLVELSFKSFNLEDYHNCYADYLKIYDDIVVNENDAVKPIGKYCGSDKPPTMLSISRAFTLIFHSDESISGEGFLANYQFIDGQNCK